MKNRAEVVIAGTTFTMTGEQDEAYMVEIAALVNQKIAQNRSSGSTIMQAAVLAACDLADDCKKTAAASDNLRMQMAEYLEENKAAARELAAAQAEISRMEKREAERETEIKHLDQLKERITSLEQQVAGDDKRRARIHELESQIAQSDMRIRSFQDDADKRNRRVKELEIQLSQAEATHREDIEEVEKSNRALRDLQARMTDADKQQRRIDELKRALKDTERDLMELENMMNELRVKMTQAAK